MKIKRLLRKKTLIVSVATIVVLSVSGVSYGLMQTDTHVNSGIPVPSESPTASPSPTITPSAEASPVVVATPKASVVPTSSSTPIPAPLATKQITHDYLIVKGYDEHEAMCFDLMSAWRYWYTLPQDTVNAKVDLFKERGWGICGYWYSIVSVNAHNFPIAAGL